MALFGVDVVRDGPLTYRAARRLHQPEGATRRVRRVERDYPLAIAAITGGTVTCEAVGSASIQGDAGFAHLCQRMGCTVKQTKDQSTVTGPGKGRRLKAIDVDMEPMTDAFMTAVALAAVAEGTTRITGVANQRVKECNRIEVMVTELGKLGISAGELDDGLWIEGVDPATLRRSRRSFRAQRPPDRHVVRGARRADRGVTIGQKSCVDKTHPEFRWHTASKLGMVYEATTRPRRRRRRRRGRRTSRERDGADASIVLVGSAARARRTWAARRRRRWGGSWSTSTQRTRPSTSRS